MNEGGKTSTCYSGAATILIFKGKLCGGNDTGSKHDSAARHLAAST